MPPQGSVTRLVNYLLPVSSLSWVNLEHLPISDYIGISGMYRNARNA